MLHHLVILGDAMKFSTCRKNLLNVLSVKLNKELSNKVKMIFLKKKNSPTIEKTRFIDQVSKNKVMGIDKLNDELLNLAQEKK